MGQQQAVGEHRAEEPNCVQAEMDVGGGEHVPRSRDDGAQCAEWGGERQGGVAGMRRGSRGDNGLQGCVESDLPKVESLTAVRRMH